MEIYISLPINDNVLSDNYFMTLSTNFYTTTMNLFIDTNSLFSDPFWKETVNVRILKASTKGVINIFISDVVYRELRENYKCECDALIKKIFELDKKC